MESEKLEFFSNIFDDSVEARRCPFRFEYVEGEGAIGPRIEEMKSCLFRPKKGCPFHSSVIAQARTCHDVENIDVPRSERSPVGSPEVTQRTPLTSKSVSLKERTFTLVGDKLI